MSREGTLAGHVLRLAIPLIEAKLTLTATMDFGPACGGQSSQMQAKGASGMLACGQMAKDIATCQSQGKKILLSLGGATAQTAFTDDTQAATFASTLWNLFGAGTGLDAGLRPFGTTTIDGFDVGKSFTDAMPKRLSLALIWKF